MTRRITLIVIHCSCSRCDRRYTFEQCRRDHIQHNHWTDIGYHWYIELDGSVHTGRPEHLQGAHVKFHNAHSLGICYEGGLDAQGRPADTRTPAQKEALRQLIAQLRLRYPRALVLGHRDLSPDLNGDGHITPNEWVKECPCFDVVNDTTLTSNPYPHGIQKQMVGHH